eukprot:CAMPEP_0117441906 /NCGR_PEP_ID=MMETSP0759-20121206/3875_1 /TAXON_ID=63605 /ORGANISM="Percolomonas cosmopolitus, Strain WS" /LENGTH=195 /DNA_ID=CAMNT_0005233773 /DNA_START=42 /DNA_END=629 /DNA_ORIENTATION=+
MSFKLPHLPYNTDALAPKISKETLEYHYGKHHQGYVNKLNTMAEQDPELAKMSLEEIIKTKTGKPQAIAGQVWNHTFYWHCMKKNGGGKPTGKLAELIEKQFGSFDEFQQKFSETANNHFGSGWAWLVRDDKNNLEIMDTHDGNNPLSQGKIPILTIDVWEHAYYVDYRNMRPSYVKAFFEVVDWDAVESRLAQV